MDCLTSTLVNTVQFVEASTGLKAQAFDDDDWDEMLVDKILEVRFFQSTKKQIDETKRESVNILRSQGWDLVWEEYWLYMRIPLERLPMDFFYAGQYEELEDFLVKNKKR